MATRPRRPSDPVAAAEAMFRPSRAAAAPRPAMRGIPIARESVTLKIDGDVLEFFQAEGPGWQDRINAALRQAAGLHQPGEHGLRPEELDATNDD